ncbi:MAG: hypothetical protein Q9164_007699, partial [Protoblastenia rupestris]
MSGTQSPQPRRPADENAVAALNKIHKIESATKKPHLIRSDLPEPTTRRRNASLDEHPFLLDEPTSDGLPHEVGAEDNQPDTVLYLAYGSNLCAETFQGKRGVRPISAINVVVPELVMTFDLPGIPYAEPCFANTKYRQPPSTPPSSTSEKSPLLSTTSPTLNHTRKNHNPHWPKGLVGVVYEVSLTDYARIIATEGGGASYTDILITCHPLPSGTTHVPPYPSTPPFKAHTLYSPVYPPGKAPPGASSKISRPDPDYAQPSVRYLKLINDGAGEHAFPSEYKDYLLSIQPYTMTNDKQRLGGWIFRMTWWPIISSVFRLNAMFADKR